MGYLLRFNCRGDAVAVERASRPVGPAGCAV